MKKIFKTESKRLLDLMSNSIYTNSDIFLRELISNASDAIDKRHFLSLTNNQITSDEYKIQINIDKENRIITISDNGIGMDENDLENNLGTIAKSGSFDFKNQNNHEDIDIIGQFGVGFYSCFMIADEVTVNTKKVSNNQAYSFKTNGIEDYEITTCEKDGYGSEVILKLKEDTENKNFSDYLDFNIIETLIKKYSDYVRYPIYLNKNDENVVINSMIPLWKKDKKDIETSTYNNFYKETYYEIEDPLKVLHYKTEGNTSYSALIFIPKKAPANFYTNDYHLGLKLFSKSIFIKDDAKELVSDYFRFIKGVIDSDDLNLNISREILQQDYQVSLIKKSLDKKIKSTLESMLKNERNLYEEFYDQFKLQLKYGCYENFGLNKDILIDLIMFKSSKTEKYITLKEYVENMKADQQDIFYATGSSIEKIKELPQLEKIIDKDFEVLLCDDQIDEFMFQILRTYQDKQFKSVNHDELNLESEKEKEILKKQTEENQSLIDKLKEILKDKVVDVKLSTKLKSHPVCLTTTGGISIEMEKALKQFNNESIKSNRVLEINPNHKLFDALNIINKDEQELKNIANLLYDQALLIAGLSIDDPAGFATRLSDLIIKSSK